MSDASWPPPPPPSSMSPTQSSAPGVVVPAGNWVRFGAFLLEILLMVVTLWIGWVVWSVFLLSQATSPAKKMLGLQIVDSETGVPATIQQMLLREMLGKVVLNSVTGGVTYFVSALMILVLPSRQGIHDYIARTVVTRR